MINIFIKLLFKNIIVSINMSQTIIDNIENYTFEIVNGSLILTPKNNKITGDMFTVGRL